MKNKKVFHQKGVWCRKTLKTTPCIIDSQGSGDVAGQSPQAPGGLEVAS